MARPAAKRDSEDSLAVRAAWLHYVGGLTQAAVADKLGVTMVKAHRLITRANQNGAVKVTIDGDIAECINLEARLSERFGLSFCEVVPDLNEEGLPLQALGIAGASFIQREMENLQGKVIGVGHGRTLSAAISAMSRVEAGTVRFVSLMGGLTRNYAANPHDVMHRLAEKTGATAYVMPVPFFANSAGDRDILLSQRGVRDVFDLAVRADLMIVGIGTAEIDAQLVASHMIDPDEIREVSSMGGVGEILGQFFDPNGRQVETSLTGRTISAGISGLTDRRIVAIAGGRKKTNAIRAVLKSRRLSGLITDEVTAAALCGDDAP